METKLLLFGLVVLVMFVGFCGCNETSIDEAPFLTLPDGTIVTGDIEQITIIEHTINKTRLMTWNERQQIWKMQNGTIQEYNDVYHEVTYSKNYEVPWDLNITGIDTNLSRRKAIYLSFIEPHEEAWIQDERIPIPPFTAYSHFYALTPPQEWKWESDGRFPYPEHGAFVVYNLSLDDHPIWNVRGVAKNNGTTLLPSVKICVNFYNETGTWLATETYTGRDLYPDVTWEFTVSYSGEHTEEISTISFNIDI